MQRVIAKNRVKDFLKSLIGKYRVVIPIKSGNTRFVEAKEKKDIDNLYLDKITEFPAKIFFLPENEIILKFKNGRATESKEKEKKTVFFGLRKCDLNALRVLDKVMYGNYLEKRKNFILIGLFCDNPDEFCFCNSMELENEKEICDLFFYSHGDKYYVSVFTKNGEKISKNFDYSTKEVVNLFKNKKQLPDKNINEDYANQIWETDSEKCLSCSACTVYCPTCNCFDIKDYLDSNLKEGERRKSSASCQLKSFSKVAGGRVFRDSRLARFKHFVYHKIVYFKERYGRYMCVGCGRCLRVCPTKIDWTDTINLLKSEQKRVKNV